MARTLGCPRFEGRRQARHGGRKKTFAKVQRPTWPKRVTSSSFWRGDPEHPSFSLLLVALDGIIEDVQDVTSVMAGPRPSYSAYRDIFFLRKTARCSAYVLTRICARPDSRTFSKNGVTEEENSRVFSAVSAISSCSEFGYVSFPRAHVVTQ
ncbi:uncharacterized protein MEPE_00754 [Melanopsichium pennsylvanicum]|uniref:Uncharacterized protein n=1 Tax=Melanopsichium pennsylvanicum TaxID=63383 RepID=A0AAJ5C329_9BASI|nr:uncharacterized protein MEPE_00754 [Melanopsichium pennsylvanicum]